ncbi:MAG: hypothetical protein OXC40_02840 [Proteobacteria bacterium]|nr:hypothetical protein [Pseudomonadota bacterium]
MARSQRATNTKLAVRVTQVSGEPVNNHSDVKIRVKNILII